MNNLETSDRNLLEQLLFKTMETENSIRESARATMNYYSTLLLSITGGILIISKDIKDPFLFGLCFLVGGFCLLVFPILAIFHYKSDYRRQIETMTIGAKIEDILGLTDKGKFQMNYWNQEAIIPDLFIETRNKHDSCLNFVDSFVKGTDMKYIRAFYSTFCFIGVCFMLYGIYNLI